MNIRHKVALAMSWGIESGECVKCLVRKLKGHKTFFNPKTHQGYLPVRVLQHNIISWFETASPEFFVLLKDETSYNGLQQGIEYKITTTKILDAAYLSPSRKIHLFENFNAYLWCLCYSLFVVFDETIQKPQLRGNYTGKIDASNSYVREALALFDYGLSLRNTYSDWDKSLPNPEEFSCKNAYYVERTNGIFVSAMNFILYHEVAHNYYHHITYTPPTSAQSKKEEYDADNFALDYILTCKDAKIQSTLKYGTVVAVCSILLLSPQLSGGYYHPDNDDRIKNALEKLDLKDLDFQWGIASLAFQLWGNHFGINYSLPATHMNYKELFYQTLAEVNKTKP